MLRTRLMHIRWSAYNLLCLYSSVIWISRKGQITLEQKFLYFVNDHLQFIYNTSTRHMSILVTIKFPMALRDFQKFSPVNHADSKKVRILKEYRYAMPCAHHI